MDRIVKFLLVFLKICCILKYVSAAAYTVKIGTDSYTNVVSEKFLSFTVDPKHLFAAPRNGLQSHNATFCMATSLTPAYLRIAGPSTSHLNFTNSTITFTDLNNPQTSSEEDTTRGSNRKFFYSSEYDDILLKRSIESFGLKKKTLHSNDISNEVLKKRPSIKKNFKDSGLSVTSFQWMQFTLWAQNAGFDLVFALGNQQKTEDGLWDANSALSFLTVAEQDNIDQIYWQLGYECNNQSLDDYLNDLETLRAIVESFPSKHWKTVGADVSKCLRADSKSDFRDYVVLTDALMDAVVLNGNSSAHELDRMEEQDRQQLLHLLSTSSTPLWLVDSPTRAPYLEFHRAVDWMTSLGFSAKNGFSVHFRELIEEEIYEPTLSFYMALLYKHLVGGRVLDVQLHSPTAVLFAHCTSLKRKIVPGSVTVFGANVAEETARFLLKPSRGPHAGEVLHFVLSQDQDGNVLLNGKLINEGNIVPVVKRMRPYKTVLLNLPAKSFGFWVIANTNIEACQEVKGILEDEPVNTKNVTKAKRSAKIDLRTLVKEGLRERVQAINSNLQNINKVFDFEAETLSRKKRQAERDNDQSLRKEKFRKFSKKFRTADTDNVSLKPFIKEDLKGRVKEETGLRLKREVEDNDEISLAKKKLRKLAKKFRSGDEPKPRLDFVRKLFGMIPRSEYVRAVRQDKGRKNAKTTKNKTNKRLHTKESFEENSIDNIVASDIGKKLNRNRRSLIITDKPNSSHKKSEELSSENEIDVDAEKQIKLWKILHKIHKQIKDLSLEEEDLVNKSKTQDSSQKEGDNVDSKEEQFVVKTKMEDDGATINFKEKTKHGILKSTVNNVVSVLGDLNRNLNRFWNAINLLN